MFGVLKKYKKNMNRDDLRLLLLNDPRRKGSFGGHQFDCEGVDYLWHTCKGPLAINEVLIPRNVFQKLPNELQDYFYNKHNCSLNCRLFHANAGHSREFRIWFRERMDRIYDETMVQLWIDQAPLKLKRTK